MATTACRWWGRVERRLWRSSSRVSRPDQRGGDFWRFIRSAGASGSFSTEMMPEGCRRSGWALLTPLSGSGLGRFRVPGLWSLAAPGDAACARICAPTPVGSPRLARAAGISDAAVGWMMPCWRNGREAVARAVSGSLPWWGWSPMRLAWRSCRAWPGGHAVPSGRAVGRGPQQWWVVVGGGSRHG